MVINVTILLPRDDWNASETVYNMAIAGYTKIHDCTDNSGLNTEAAQEHRSRSAAGKKIKKECACLTIIPLSEFIYILYNFTSLKLCLATATHNFKSVKITHISLIWDQSFSNLEI